MKDLVYICWKAKQKIKWKIFIWEVITAAIMIRLIFAL